MKEDDEPLFEDSDEEAGPSTAKKGAKESDNKMMFRKELKAMLYGFGDEKEPLDTTVEFLEVIVLDYIKELCERSLNTGKQGKMGLEDIYYIIRRDEKKFSRVKDLLDMSKELKNARKMFDESVVPE